MSRALNQACKCKVRGSDEGDCPNEIDGEVLMREAAFERNSYGRVGFDWHLDRRTLINKSTERQNCCLCLGM